MKLFQLETSRLPGDPNSAPETEGLYGKRRNLFFPFRKKTPLTISGQLELVSQKTLEFLEEIKSIGFTRTMDEHDRRKLSIFNQLNFLQFITGVIVPVSCLFGNGKFGVAAFLVASLPAFVSFIVLGLNFYFKHEAGIIFYFILYPVVTSIVYLNGMNLGLELFFILYGILAVFFVHDISRMLFSIGLSMISYFILAVVCQKYTYQLQVSNLYFYLFNQLTAIVFIFYGLFLIKKENTVYQFGILTTNHALQEKNRKIQRQKQEIEESAELLQRHTQELTELNALKNKLFSVIAHDLKSPIYALRNLFNHIQENNMPASEIRKMIPAVVNDLNYTTGLMENLLSWAKSQMHSAASQPEELDISSMAEEMVRLLQLQAQAKKVVLQNEIRDGLRVVADKSMISLVLRNLLSNAIKFTPEKGRVSIRASETDRGAEISVHDTGVGISQESIHKINQQRYYTTPGTASEAGTGLGLMLCREFLHKNGTTLRIQSEPGRGSIFSFSLPLSA